MYQQPGGGGLISGKGRGARGGRGGKGAGRGGKVGAQASLDRFAFNQGNLKRKAGERVEKDESVENDAPSKANKNRRKSSEDIEEERENSDELEEVRELILEAEEKKSKATKAKKTKKTENFSPKRKQKQGVKEDERIDIFGLIQKKDGKEENDVSNGGKRKLPLFITKGAKKK